MGGNGFSIYFPNYNSNFKHLKVLRWIDHIVYMITKFRVPIGPFMCGAMESPFALPLALRVLCIGF